MDLTRQNLCPIRKLLVDAPIHPSQDTTHQPDVSSRPNLPRLKTPTMVQHVILGMPWHGRVWVWFAPRRSEMGPNSQGKLIMTRLVGSGPDCAEAAAVFQRIVRRVRALYRAGPQLAPISKMFDSHTCCGRLATVSILPSFRGLTKLLAPRPHVVLPCCRHVVSFLSKGVLLRSVSSSRIELGQVTSWPSRGGHASSSNSLPRFRGCRCHLQVRRGARRLGGAHNMLGAHLSSDSF